MVFVPVLCAEVVNVAIPPDTGAVPITVEPTEKTTVPVALLGVTVAVRVAGSPYCKVTLLVCDVVVVAIVSAVVVAAVTTVRVPGTVVNV
jgi:hypothetical protein